MRERCVLGRRFAKLQRLWPEPVEGTICGLKGVSVAPNAWWRRSCWVKFPCGLLEAIKVPTESSGDLREPNDKSLTCDKAVKRQYFPTMGKCSLGVTWVDTHARMSEKAVDRRGEARSLRGR